MNRGCKIFLLVLISIVDLADMACDWFFYVDMVTSEKGLVYGKPDQDAVTSLLVFSIIGSVGYILEITNLVTQFRRGKPFINVELVGALIVWFEDLPQLGISIYISLCREEEVSWFQMAKAGVIVISIFFRFIFSIVKCCKNKKRDHTRSKCYRAVAIVGLVVALLGAGTVFLFTKAERNQYGHIIFSEPETVIEGKFNYQRYFRSVSIFVSHPAFKTSGSTDTRNWIRMTSIDSVRNSPHKDILFLMEFSQVDKDVRIIIQKNDYTDKKCYTTGEASVTTGNQCNRNMDSKINTNRYMFRFTFIPPAVIFRKKIFGDIIFNIKPLTNGNCGSNLIRGANMEDISVHYFRSEHEHDDHLVLESTGARFYQKEDLEDVRDVWKTGFFHCEPSGNVAPQLDTSITVPCKIYTYM